MKRPTGIPFMLTVSLMILLPFSGYCQDDDPVLMTLGKHKVYVSEFMHMYQKNLDQTMDQREDPQTYLDRFIDFKLKVIEAEERGLDKKPDFVREFEGYKDQLARPYLNDREMVDTLVREAYDHMKYEVNASHILIRCPMDASPEDTLDAYERIMEVRKKILNGIPFQQMARAVSDDPSVKSNGGNLGYFTALQMVYPFEKCVYNLKPEMISMPVRTRFGYHLILLHDKRPNQGTVQVAHIMVAVPRNADPEKKKNAYEKVQEIYRQLQEGTSFDTLAAKYSDDYNSARRGGKLPWFGSGKMVPAFEKAAFALKNPGEISEPIQTGYGWHIIKLLGKKPLPPFEEIESELRRKVLTSDRAAIARDVWYRKLMTRYGITTDSTLLNEIIIRSTDNDGNFVYGDFSDLEKAELASGDGFLLPVSDLTGVLKRNKPGTGESPSYFVHKTYRKILRDKLFEFEKSHLAEVEPDYRTLLNEYHDGMLLFEIMDQEVWSKATRDTVGLEKYYEMHKSEFTTPRKSVVDIFELGNPKTARSLMKNIKRRNRNKITQEEFEQNIRNKDVRMIGIRDTIAEGNQEYNELLTWRRGISGLRTYNGRYYIVYTYKVIPEQIQPLDEVLGLVTADYQEYLEQEWLKQLRRKFPVTVNQEAFKKIRNQTE